MYVYLPPQYFQRSFRAYRFPVIELIHGQPGVPPLLAWMTPRLAQPPGSAIMATPTSRKPILA